MNLHEKKEEAEGLRAIGAGPAPPSQLPAHPTPHANQLSPNQRPCSLPNTLNQAPRRSTPTSELLFSAQPPVPLWVSAQTSSMKHSNSSLPPDPNPHDLVPIQSAGTWPAFFTLRASQPKECQALRASPLCYVLLKVIPGGRVY